MQTLYGNSGNLLTQYCIAVVFTFFCFLNAQPAFSETIDRVLATVDGEAITYADYQQFLNIIDEAGKKDAIDGKFLKALIEEKIILQEAKRKGIEVSETEIDRRIDEFKEQNTLS